MSEWVFGEWVNTFLPGPIHLFFISRSVFLISPIGNIAEIISGLQLEWLGQSFENAEGAEFARSDAEDFFRKQYIG